MGRNVKQNSASIEINTRARLVKAGKDHIARMNVDRDDAIAAINERTPLDKAVAVMPDFDGSLILQCPGNVRKKSRFPAWLAKYDKILRQLERTILEGEAIVKDECPSVYDVLGDAWECDECGCFNSDDAGECAHCGAGSADYDECDEAA